MHFDYSLTPKTSILRISHKTIFMTFCASSSPIEKLCRQTCLGSKSSQNASIFHKKNYGGVKKYFLVFYPLKIQFVRFFLHIFVGLIQKDPTLRFWVKAFQNQYIFWWKNPLTDLWRHFYGISTLWEL